jgi:hypothetical protein
MIEGRKGGGLVTCPVSGKDCRPITPAIAPCSGRGRRGAMGCESEQAREQQGGVLRRFQPI